MLFLFPIGDDNKGRTITPWVNYSLIVLNLLVYFVFQASENGTQFTVSFSTVPKEIVTGKDIVRPAEIVKDQRTGQEYLDPGLGETPIPVWLTLLTSMFMHGSVMHLLGNMLYLWIFGDNIEDDLGHARYLGFYLLTGLLASLAHVLMNAWGDNALVPCLGASGAIAGVLGGYLIMHPHRGVHVLVFRFIVTMPAFVVVGLWFLLQIYGGMGTMGDTGGGVAYSAHIGGFLAGMAVVMLFAKPKAPPEFVSRDDIQRLREQQYRDNDENW